MQREQVLSLMKANKAQIFASFDVKDLAIFGSTARDQAREDSDIDVLVEFGAPATAQRYFGVQFYLEDLLGHPVDLVTRKALRPEFAPYVEKDLIHV